MKKISLGVLLVVRMLVSIGCRDNSVDNIYGNVSIEEKELTHNSMQTGNTEYSI